MDLFSILSLLGGLSLFLFGMSVLGQALERRAGGRLRVLLEKLSGGKWTGFWTGFAITAAIQSSSAATVMVVGFVNSGVMTLRQAVHVIMGANTGTTVTAWLLSLTGISGGNWFLRLLKPASFTPALAFGGILLYLSGRDERRKDTGAALLGFSTLMYGMEAMTASVAGLGEVPAFRQMLVLFQNPVLGVLAGAVLTALIQSSSASVGILQALAAGGRVSRGAAVPIVMGQNIGTCVTALLSSIGTNKNARRAALVHLSFNALGTAAWLSVFCLARALAPAPFLEQPVSPLGVAAIHTVFNLLCTALMLPLSGFLERLVTLLVPDAPEPKAVQALDERLFAAPSIALERGRQAAREMAQTAASAFRDALDAIAAPSPDLAGSIRAKEEAARTCEDALSTYLVHLSARRIRAPERWEAAKLLRLIGDFGGIGEDALYLLETAGEMQQKGLGLSDGAEAELSVLTGAVRQILDLSLAAFLRGDPSAAAHADPLEQVISQLKDQLRTRHILRMQTGGCSVAAGFAWADLLARLEHSAAHCAAIAACALDVPRSRPRPPAAPQDPLLFQQLYRAYARKFTLP